MLSAAIHPHRGLDANATLAPNSGTFVQFRTFGDLALTTEVNSDSPKIYGETHAGCCVRRGTPTLPYLEKEKTVNPFGIHGFRTKSNGGVDGIRTRDRRTTYAKTGRF